MRKILPPLLSHEKYARIVKKHYPNDPIANILTLIDLTPLRLHIRHLYSTKGRKSYPPEVMLRSLLAMVLCGCFSIRAWTGKESKKYLRNPDSDYYRIISGFVNIKIPAHNTFSDFIKRLMKDDKLVLKIFFHCFVKTSIKLGLIKLKELFITIDSTKVRTFSNPKGKKNCSCHRNSKCEHKPVYSDKEAQWGYDHYRNTYIFGYALHILSCAVSQLPILFTVTDAKRNDGPIGYLLLLQFYQLKVLGLKVIACVLDAAYDAIRIYKFIITLLKAYPIIALNKRNTGNYKYLPTITVNLRGVPICIHNLPFVFWGYCRDRMRLKWRWPYVLKSLREKCCECPHFPCSQSSYGRVVYTYPKDNYRLFTCIPRESKKWKEYSNLGSAKERINSYLKEKYGMCNLKVRGKKAVTFRLFLACSCMHIIAQAETQNSKVTSCAA